VLGMVRSWTNLGMGFAWAGLGLGCVRNGLVWAGHWLIWAWSGQGMSRAVDRLGSA
jgi:hypothetical protein